MNKVLCWLACSAFLSSPASAQLLTNPLHGKAAPYVQARTPQGVMQAFCDRLASDGVYAFEELGISTRSAAEFLETPNGQATDLTMRASRCEVVRVLGKLVTLHFRSPDHGWVITQMSREIDARLKALVDSGQLAANSTDEDIDTLLDEFLVDIIRRGDVPFQESTVRIRMEAHGSTWWPSDDTLHVIQNGLGLRDAREVPRD